MHTHEAYFATYNKLISKLFPTHTRARIRMHPHAHIRARAHQSVSLPHLIPLPPPNPTSLGLANTGHDGNDACGQTADNLITAAQAWTRVDTTQPDGTDTGIGDNMIRHLFSYSVS